MSQFLIDSAERNLQIASRLMQKGKYREAFEFIHKAENTSLQIKAEDILLRALTMKGQLKQATESYEEALKIYTSVIRKTEKYLFNDPENEFYQDIIKKNLLNIGNLGLRFSNMGLFPLSRTCCEVDLEISQKMLNLFPEDEIYQGCLGHSLMDFGSLLADMGRFEESMKKSEEALNIYKKLLRKYPNELMYQSYIGTIIGNLGNVLKAIGRSDEAINRYEESLYIRENLLQNDPENKNYQSSVAFALNNLGTLLSEMGRDEEANNRYEESLYNRKKLIKKYPDNLEYKYDAGCTYNHLASSLLSLGCYEEAEEKYDRSYEIFEELIKIDPKNTLYRLYTASMLLNQGPLILIKGHIEKAKRCLEIACEICKGLLEDDPENVLYQAQLGMTYNFYADFIYVIEQEEQERIEEAKKIFEKVLEIYTEPMQYMTIIQKSHSIIRLIEINIEQAERETNSYRQIEYLEEAYQLCKKHQDFFSKYGLKHEKKLVMEAGFSSYVDYVIKNIRWEKDPKKRVIGYEKAIKTIEKIGKIDDDIEIVKMASSTFCYLEGRKLVNEALDAKQPDLELIKQAINQFKDAKETYKKANVCYCIYIGLLKILENVEIFEEENGTRAKNLIQQIIRTFPEKIDPSIKASFEEIAKIFDGKDIKSRKKHLEEFDGKVRAIEYKALENIFGHVHEKIKDYLEEPFSPNVLYDDWKLRIKFDDPEKVIGKLTIKAGNKIIFSGNLSKEEIERNLVEIDYLKVGYFPQSSDEISFTTPGQKKLVKRSIDYFESVGRDNKTRIFQYDCSNSVCINRDLQIAVVQLKYHAYVEDSVVKLTADDAYHRKVVAVLDAVKDEADIVVFSEFSIPFDYLKEIEQYAKDTGVIVVAGSHYVTEEQLGKYGEFFSREFVEEDLRKNISPVVIPSIKIVHNEKLLGAREERELYFKEGMKAGKVNHILKLRDDLRIGVMICYEYLNADLRNRLILACDVILVPQTNPNPTRFYETAKNDLNNPICSGNRAYVMANGIFTLGEEEVFLGGSTGIVSTLDKYSYEKQDEGIIKPVDGVMEQFVLLASINKDFNPAKDTQVGQVPLTVKLIHIFEESEITSDSRLNGKGFIELLETIKNCEKRDELKEILNSEENKAIIKTFSPLMHKHIQDLRELTLDEMKKKCRFIMIPQNGST